MLVISRKPNESFLIGDDIEIVVLDVQNDKIRIGINAPKDIPILRKELYETKKSNKEAMVLADKDIYNKLKAEFNKKNGKNA